MTQRFQFFTKHVKYYSLSAFILINLLIAGQSLVPADQSAQQSNWVGNFFASIANWVTPVEPSFVLPNALVIDGPSTIYVGDPGRMTATVSPNETTDKSIVWSSSDDAICDITSGGYLVPKMLGSVTITAQSSIPEIQATHVLEVIPFPQVTSFDLHIESSSIFVGTSTTLTLTDIQPARADISAVVFSSLNPEVAQVTPEGIVQGIAPGTARLQANLGESFVQEVDVEVLEKLDVVVPTSIAIVDEDGFSGPFTSYIYAYKQLAIDWGEVVPTDTGITWISSDTTIATISPLGLVYGFKFEGTATLTAIANANPTLKATVTISMLPVKPLALSLTAVDGKTQLAAGSTLRINRALTAPEGLTVTDQQLVWTSSDESVATVSSSGDFGTLVGIKPGNVTITARSAMDETIEASLSIIIVEPDLFSPEEIVELSSFLRKALGHFSLFAVNGFFGYWTFYLFKKKSDLNGFFIRSITVGLFASIVAELLQLFGPGRAMTLIDMTTNYFGYLLANFMLLLLFGTLWPSSITASKLQDRIQRTNVHHPSKKKTF